MKRILIVLVAFVLSLTVGLQVVQAGKMERLLRELEIKLEKPGFGRDFFVCQMNSPFFSMAREKYQPYADGVRRLHTSITEAYNACVADRGDTVYVVSGYTETALTTQLTLNKNDISLIGLGPDYPTIGGAGTYAAISVTADNVTLKGLHIVPSRTNNSAIMVHIDGTTTNPVEGAIIEDCYFQAQYHTVSNNDVLVLDSALDFTIKDCIFTAPYGTTNDPATFLDIQSICTNTRIDNIIMQGFVSSSGIADDQIVKGLIMTDVIIAVTSTDAQVEAITLDSNPIGVASNCMFSGSNEVTLTNAALGTGMAVQNCRVVGGKYIARGERSGAICPIVSY